MRANDRVGRCACQAKIHERSAKQNASMICIGWMSRAFFSHMSPSIPSGVR